MKAGECAITLRGVKLHGKHGVAEQERLVGATYELTVVMRMHLPAACETDRLDHTVNYAEAYECVKAEFDKPSQLIEHVAWRIGRALLDKFDIVQSIEIELVKLTPPIPCYDGSASVKIFLEK